MTPIAQKIYQANIRLYQEADNPLRSHGPDHHLRVYQYACKLASALGVSYDEDILAGAALLHDLAAYYPGQTAENYHEHDHVLAGEALRELDFPETKIQAVLQAIANHGSDAKYKSTEEPIETTLLRDADKMDVFGAIGVARIVMVRTLKGDNLEDIVADFWTGGHLERKWQSITFDQTRQLLEQDYAYSRDFFGSLAKQL